MKIFILEDDRERISFFQEFVTEHDITIAENASDAIAILSSNKFDLLMLDHDLGGRQLVSTDEKNTGSEVVRWIVSSKMECPPVIIHSYNWSGAARMEADLKAYGVNACQIKFYDVISRFKDGTLFA